MKVVCYVSLQCAIDGNPDKMKVVCYVSLQCARDGNPDNMKRLLEVTSNVKKKVNQHDDEGLSALHYAARYNHYPIVVMLISAGASE